MQWRIIWALWFLIWGWVASVWHQITDVKHTCPQPLTGLVSRLVFTGLIPALFTNLWLWPPKGCRRTEGRLSTTLHANNKKEDWIGLIQVDDDEERKDWQAWRVCGCQLIGTWNYPIRAYLDSWNLVSPLYRINGWMCWQITTPGKWQTNTKPLQHQTFAKEKFRDSIVTTQGEDSSLPVCSVSCTVH